MASNKHSQRGGIYAFSSSPMTNRSAVKPLSTLSINRTHNWRHLVFFLATAFVYILFAGPLTAQQKVLDEAREVAARVQSFYDQTTDISAEFFQTYVHVLYQRTDRSKGHVVFKKPGMMRWDYARPNGKIVLSDGQKLLVYEPGEANENGQVYEQKLEKAQLPQALAFLMGSGRLENNFEFRLLDAKQKGFPNGYVLELRPRNPSPHYERIIFYVEKDPRLSGLVRRVLIIDPSGNRNRFDFSQFQFNRHVETSLFQWKPPAGTRRVKP